MRAFAVNNCEFEVTFKRCGIYQVPFPQVALRITGKAAALI
jgi:hypothetical protein